MDLTKLPQELIFFHKQSIDDYDIDNESSVDGILYEYLIGQSFTVPFGWDKEKLILTMFNDANYLSTIIILDERFSLHTHSWIEYYSIQWNDDSIVAVILRMVKFYLSYTTDLPSHVEKAVNILISDHSKLKEAKASGIAMDTHLMFTSPTHTISRGHFKILSIGNELLRYDTFKGSVNWAPITNNYNINDIIRVTRILGKDIQDQVSLIYNIYNSFQSSEYENNRELDELISIFKSHLVDKGKLLSKKELIEEYKKEQEIKQEIEQEIANSYFQQTDNCEELKQQYEEQIDVLKKEIKQLTEENALLNEQLEVKEPVPAFNAQTQMPCLTNTQMGILMRGVALMIEKPVPGKTTIGEVVENISGYKATTVNQNMKGAHRNADKEAVAKAIESKYPKLAAKIRKL